jgi:transcriptional regulator with XRE-family HTH domain
MSQEEQFINGDLLRLRREARGWVLNDMATRACMSIKQIRQLEEGGVSSFYSPSVKITAAKKVGALLGLSAEEVLTQPQLEQPQPLDVSVADSEVHESAPLQEVSHAEADGSSIDTAENSTHVEAVALVEPLPSQMPVSQAPKSKTSFWIIAGLFATALAVAAYMQPQEEPSVEPAPPLEVVPSDAADAASVAEPSADAASSKAEPSAAPQKSASSVVAPVANAVVYAARPASALAVAPASAESKAP